MRHIDQSERHDPHGQRPEPSHLLLPERGGVETRGDGRCSPQPTARRWSRAISNLATYTNNGGAFTDLYGQLIRKGAWRKWPVAFCV